MRTVLSICLLALVAAGCGSAPVDSAKEFKGEEQKIAAVVEEVEKAGRAKKPDKVCATLLSDGRLATLKKLGTNCTTAVRDSFGDADTFDLTVDDVRITGDRATVKVISGTGSDEKSDTLELERDGTWKIDSLR